MFDNAAVVTVLCFAVFVLAYFTYGRFVARRIYQFDPERPTPAHTRQDGIDFVPTRVPILFGHHFASIAGLGPILGPAIAVIWGWVPAVLWVVLGCVFIGAVHDLGALRVSLAYRGCTIGDVCRHLMGLRARLLALLIIFFMMSVAMGAFVSTISALFVSFNPDAIIPSLGLMLVAVTLGISVYKLRLPLALCTVVALAAFAGLILWGVEQPLTTYEWFASPQTCRVLDEAKGLPPGEAPDGTPIPAFEAPYGATAAIGHLTAAGNTQAAEDVKQAAGEATYGWMIALLFYGFVASVLPVWLLLQPRDYINSFQLYFALTALLIGLVTCAVLGGPETHIDAPMFRPAVALNAADTLKAEGGLLQGPSWFPLLFVTIACGAVSGFHSLVSSGTTVRQLNKESDALFIGYGSMLVEAALAILVIMACVAGVGAKHWQPGGVYSAWTSIGAKGMTGLAAQLHAVVNGGANYLAYLGIPQTHGRAVLAVTVVAFALTTLDSATRLLRFNVEEICRSVRLDFLANRYFASLVAVAGIAFFALVPAGKALWTLFGTVNQLLAGLTLLVVSVFLYKFRRPVLYTLVPMLIMLFMSIAAMAVGLASFWSEKRWSLVVVSAIILAMALWLVVEAMVSLATVRASGDSESAPPDGLSSGGETCG